MRFQTTSPSGSRPSSTADAIAAFCERRVRHTARTHLDYALNMALKPGDAGAWSGDDAQPAVPVNGMDTEPRWRTVAENPLAQVGRDLPPVAM